jgi:hypothetical protein
MAKTNLKMKINVNSSAGNIFYILAEARKLLQQNGKSALADEMQKRVLASHAYEDAKHIIAEYINVTYYASDAYEME